MFQASSFGTSGLLFSLMTRAIGRKAGETKMVKNGDAVEAHQVLAYFKLTLK